MADSAVLQSTGLEKGMLLESLKVHCTKSCIRTKSATKLLHNPTSLINGIHPFPLDTIGEANKYLYESPHLMKKNEVKYFQVFNILTDLKIRYLKILI